MYDKGKAKTIERVINTYRIGKEKPNKTNEKLQKKRN
jgi:hypothetical protein